MSIWGQPQFFGVRAAAANIGTSVGDYTVQDFQADYPQFFTSEGLPLVPQTQLQSIIDMANVSIQPDKWLQAWRYGVGLYVAHYATLSLRTLANSSATPQQAAATGALMGLVKSATLGDASVTYDTTAITQGTVDWGDLNSTAYGQLLANRAKLVGMGGSYAI